jgi:hypothetical protein
VRESEGEAEDVNELDGLDGLDDEAEASEACRCGKRFESAASESSTSLELHSRRSSVSAATRESLDRCSSSVCSVCVAECVAECVSEL